MEEILTFFSQYAEYSHYLIFFALMLAGLNVPISEDLLIITGGVLASTIIPENTEKLFIAIFLGCYLSDWESYWVGRLLGPNLWKIPWFSRMVSKKRVEKVHSFYEKYGFLTLLIGRFIPFGVRNCLFLSAGLSKMNFLKFIISDGIACIISNIALFSLAYSFGKNYDKLLAYLREVNIGVFSAFLLMIISYTIWCFFRNKASR
ncbi:Inner membrane protein BB_0250 [Chlamydiales bacterium SCGC AB-751-O23]|jgi:membrane-associated protein|nr:Inner membrane protein BB_0250 [Chlamydiales bacterium SCGC AB-751-O23]